MSLLAAGRTERATPPAPPALLPARVPPSPGGFLLSAPSSSSSSTTRCTRARAGPNARCLCPISAPRSVQVSCCRSAPPLRWMGRGTGASTKQKEEERQRVVRRSVARGCQRKSLAVFLSTYLSQPLQLLWDPLLLVACEEEGKGTRLVSAPKAPCQPRQGSGKPGARGGVR